jgi:hypothetical protein
MILPENVALPGFDFPISQSALITKDLGAIVTVVATVSEPVAHHAGTSGYPRIAVTRRGLQATH